MHFTEGEARPFRDLLTHQLNVYLTRVNKIIKIFCVIMLCMFIYVLCIACMRALYRTLAKIYFELNLNLNLQIYKPLIK